MQSESGDESPIGCFRGVYDNSYTYYWGDEVIYDDGTGYSMYRFVSKNPVKGISPNNSNYWIIVAQRGVGISNTDVLYAISSSNTTAPTSGWQTTAPAWKDGYYIWSKTKVVYTDGDIVYTDAACITGGKGETGNGISSIIEQYYLSSSATSLLMVAGLIHVQLGKMVGIYGHDPLLITQTATALLQRLFVLLEKKEKLGMMV